MNDRFKFRVWITAPITQDVEEEKEIGFYIYDIALYDDGGIGFSRDSLLDALDKLNLTEGQRNEIEDYISDNSYSGDWEWYVISFDIIEQCTGLKDKNCKLIYEDDIVTFEKSEKTGKLRKGVVKYYKQYCWFFVEVSENKWARSFNTIPDRQYLEVIGNIHENPDLLENEE